jgi:ribosomal protein L37AE/L43A
MSDCDEGDRDAKCNTCGVWILEPVGKELWLCEECQKELVKK